MQPHTTTTCSASLCRKTGQKGLSEASMEEAVNVLQEEKKLLRHSDFNSFASSKSVTLQASNAQFCSRQQLTSSTSASSQFVTLPAQFCSKQLLTSSTLLCHNLRHCRRTMQDQFTQLTDNPPRRWCHTVLHKKQRSTPATLSMWSAKAHCSTRHSKILPKLRHQRSLTARRTHENYFQPA